MCGSKDFFLFGLFGLVYPSMKPFVGCETMNCTVEISFTIEMFHMKNDNDFRSILFFEKVKNIKLLTHDV